MQKSTKIISTILVATVAICCVIAGVGSVLNEQEQSTTAETVMSTTEALTVATTESVTVSTTVATTTQTTQAAVQVDKLILGKWVDSANMSGFEFFENGTVAFTYINLESFNIPFEGKAENGMYTVNGNEVTIKYSIYPATISRTYQATINGNILTLKDLEENTVSTYQRPQPSTAESSTLATTTASTTQASSTTATPASTTQYQSTVDDIIGSWISSDGHIGYNFKYDGIVSVKLSNAVIPSLGSSATSGTYNGVYMTQDNKITIQYTVNTVKVTESYVYSTNVNSLSLTDSTGSSISFVREGTGYAPVNEDELLGVWRDSANMSGYEFKSDGIVKINLVGSFTGMYETNGNRITITYSIYGAAISETYTYAITNNVLTLTNVSNNNVSTYLKQ